jgi:hypothetical protein
VKATLLSAPPQGRTFTYLYQVGSQTVQVTFDGLSTEAYFVTGERGTPSVSAAIQQARADHSLLSL